MGPTQEDERTELPAPSGHWKPRMTAEEPDVTSRSGSSRLLRRLNDRAALNCLFQRQHLTRPELVELTGLSKPTASQVIKRLRAAELVTVVGRTSGGPGPRADVYALNPDATYGAAVSVTEPDGLAVALVDATGQTRHEQRSTVSYSQGNVTELISSTIQTAFSTADLSAQRLSRVHIAVPGSYDARHDTVNNIDVPGCDRPGWTAQLSENLKAQVAVDNDVNLATLAEGCHGAGGDAGFALLWLGERGIGLGIDIGDGMLTGFRGAAGEIGYLPVGEGQTLQEVAGGPAIKQLAADHGFTAASARDAVAIAVSDNEFLSAMAQRLFTGLAAVAAVADPKRVVLAGEIGTAGGERLCLALSRRTVSTPFDCSVVPSTVTGDAVLRGAADAVASTLRQAILAEDHTRSTLRRVVD